MQPTLQVLVLASVFLLLGSLASVAVPKLAGELIDDCINLSKFSSEAAAKHKVDGATQPAPPDRCDLQMHLSFGLQASCIYALARKPLEYCPPQGYCTRYWSF